MLYITYNTRYILITGCDHGYGNLLAQRLDMLGCHVIAACATDGGMNRLQQMTSSRLRAFKFDFGSENQIKQAVDFVQVNIPDDTGNVGVLSVEMSPPFYLRSSDAMADVRLVIGENNSL